MALLLTLARGAVAGVGKRPAAFRGELPELRLSRPGVRIDAARLAAYAEVCGFADPGSGVLPLTYPHILGFPLAARIMAARAFPLPLAGLVHTGTTISARGALRVTDRPELSVRTEGLRAHRRGTEVVLVTRARLGGEVVWEDRSTYLARHRVADGAGARAAERPAGGETAGELPEREVWPLPADLGRRHARVSGDWNPIHLYAWTARPLGFRRPIVHGMWTLARCVAVRPEVRYVSVEFRRPVPLPATVHYAAQGPDFALRGPDGVVHLVGRAGLTASSARRA
ncbi:MaoC family dehydratase [Streptomyces polygonati]|uniref:MaoC family dehydratase n=1 Tax=Streptomyces polygonati TaxID=1617087 RepID=A0ABV8HM32_9ACTN